MAQKVVLKVLTMTDDKTKQKAIEAAADIFGVDSIAADLKDQKLTVIGQMDTVAVAKRLKKVGKSGHHLSWASQRGEETRRKERREERGEETGRKERREERGQKMKNHM
ncbi:hypothetical protein Patl1_20121 [Pistacia atlantica]|uniref:Uncharacterized protein n=1 Tax=Pistacia atlantica TaxID=434234 RepID=A0ACC1BH76_9ROSI|nr:hypothetical protein Patl1_20121 [Pistacia atlantica]